MRRSIAICLIAVAPVVGFVGGYSLAGASASSVFNWGDVNTGGTVQHSYGDVPTSLVVSASAIQASNSDGYALIGGAEYSWGYGVGGELGNGGLTNSFNAAVQVSFPTGTVVTSLGQAGDAAYATDSNGVGWSWGGAVGHAQTGLCQSGVGAVATPEQVAGLPPVVAVAGGAGHVSWVTSTGLVYSCGKNNDGQLGNGTNVDSAVPVLVPGLTGVVAISGGWGNEAALTSSGQVYTWGYGAKGAIGNGLTRNAFTPQLVSGTFSSVYVGGSYAGNTHMLAITTSGMVEGWGDNQFGELGPGVTTATAAVPTLSGVAAFTAIATGGGQSFGLDSSGVVWGWGDNGDGQVGIGTRGGNVLTPTAVLTGASLVSATADHSLAG